MIGPLTYYWNLYVAACGRAFGTFTAGVSHERECEECQAIIKRKNDEDVVDDDAIWTHKNIPLPPACSPRG